MRYFFANFSANVVIRLCNSRFCANIIRQPQHGALAQLARVPVWQTGGQGFESPKLHHHKQTASQKRCRLLMVVKPAVGANLRAILCQRRVSQLVSFISQSVQLVRARRFGGLQSKTLSPFPTARDVPIALTNAPLLRYRLLWRNSPKLHQKEPKTNHFACKSF